MAPGRLNAVLANIAKQKMIRASVVDVLGKKCSVRVSGSGAKLTGIEYFGVQPQIGDYVMIDYRNLSNPIAFTSTDYISDNSASLKKTSNNSNMFGGPVVLKPEPTNELPVANDQHLTTPFETPIDITLTGKVGSGSSLTFSIDEIPVSGTVTGTDENVTYSPDAGFFGMDKFDFKVDDGLGTAIGSIFITIDQDLYVIYPPTPGTGGVENCLNSSSANGSYGLTWNRTSIDGNPMDATTRSAVAWMRCVLRSMYAENPTRVTTRVVVTGKAIEHLKCYAIDSYKNPLAQGTIVATLVSDKTYDLSITFNSVAALEINGFMLVCDVGLDTTGDPLYDAGSSVTLASGLVGSATLTRPIYDPENGHIQYYLNASAYQTHWLFATYFDPSFKFSSSTGSMGTLYCYINMVTQSGGNPFLRLDQHGGAQATWEITTQSTYQGLWLVKRTNGVTYGQYPWSNFGLMNTSPYSVQNVVYSANTTFDFYWSGSTPERSASLGAGSLYNVCPIAWP